jgi:hypothetical protein
MDHTLEREKINGTDIHNEAKVWLYGIVVVVFFSKQLRCTYPCMECLSNIETEPQAPISKGEEIRLQKFIHISLWILWY